MNGKCRRCRQPGHVARDCRRAWSGPAPRLTRTGAATRQAPAAALSVAPAADVGTEGANSGPPRVAPAVEVSERRLCSGDEEVLVNASAAVIGSSSAPRRTRASWSRRRKKVAAAPEVTSLSFAYVATTCFDVVRMDTEEEEVPD